MASAKKEPSNRQPLAGVAAAAAAIAMSALWHYQPLHSLRPRQEHRALPPSSPTVQVAGRMWQDPFDVAAEAKVGDTTPCDVATRKDAENPLDGRPKVDSDDTPITVLIVPMAAGTLAEDSESRTRERYAVVSALAVRYEAVGRGALWIGHVPTSTGRALGQNTSLQQTGSGTSHAASEVAKTTCDASIGEVAPYEWFVIRRRHDGPVSRPQRVLVVWIREDPLAIHPWATIDDVVGWLRPDRSDHQLPCIDFRVIGPHTSDTLRAMLNAERASSDLTMFSPSATAAASAMEPSSKNDAEIVNKLAERHVTYRRTVVDDYTLAKALVAELDRRGVDIADEAGAVIVTESDTLYGRTFPSTLRRAAAWYQCQSSPLRPPSAKNCDNAAWSSGRRSDNWKNFFSYLKGLDGSVPQLQPEAAKAPDGQKKSPRLPTQEEIERRREALERPEGDGQLDYLRRLVSSIQNLAGDSREHCGFWQRLFQRCPRLRAIGILGSDVYDKLLILQALRGSFPDVVFFTTDLDALFLHPAETPWTRNLVVASSYGLTLAQKFQRGVPPFRDSYQTAIFAATLAAIQREGRPDRGVPQALRAGPGPSKDRQRNVRWMPRIFEVGRDGAVDLSRNCHSWGQPGRSDVVGRPSLVSLHPFFELGALLVLLTAAVFGPVLPHLGFQPRRNRTKLAAVLGIMAATPFFFLLVARRFGVDGEPFTLLAGVSLWPTEVIRTWVIALALTLLVHVWRTLPVNAATIAAECRWSTSVPSPHALCLEVFRAWRTFRIPPSLQITQWENDPNNQAKNAGELWAEYMIRSSFVPFAVRVGLSSLSFMCTAWVVIGVFGPPFVPYRGHWVKWIDLGVLGCAILSILMLSFSVVDATRLCVAFVRQLCRLEHPWDPEVLSEVKARWETGDLAATERLRMTVIAERSTVVARFVVYPAVVIALMMAARSAFFDDWGMPVALIAVFALFGVFVIGSAMILRNATQQAHTVALTRLRERVWVLRGRLTARALSERRSLLAAIECIEDMPHSAFASIFKSPVLAALLVPSGSFGILSLLEAWYAFQGK